MSVAKKLSDQLADLSLLSASLGSIQVSSEVAHNREPGNESSKGEGISCASPQ